MNTKFAAEDLQVTLEHWRCGGIPCSVCPVPLLIKVTKAHLLYYSTGIIRKLKPKLNSDM